MTPVQILIILALTLFALYRQSISHEVSLGPARFKWVWIYGVVGLLVGGTYMPTTITSWSVLGSGVLFSIIIGMLQGRLIEIWQESDGRIFCKGTPLTMTLFLLLIGSKWIIGTLQYLYNQPTEQGGFGEILIMIAVMAAFEVEIVRRRIRVLYPDNPVDSLPEGQ
ncbi:putative membrane protein [Yersinia rohdei]|uniref:Membrane protein n=1 Tax=Yersinia rohdei TaxID=29485 RepID=A0A0U1HSI6_YERRO|nr:hypothetical protein [Yersinia rohdei]AJJ12472.1 putative membrane protein [Yersinia rohdei]EEQ01304.1 hypothetical protein yrohd0001_34510 [Yersinia rohdei ATCC 43380]MDN0093858.1 hypothetical protein [Yersinia rohdei]CND90221.1 Uncharacterised protein [Yersinia rohdei]CNI21193.1 Uncharacterised protein [Yersinia rohdei]